MGEPDKIARTKPRTKSLGFENSELMAKREVLKSEVASRPEQGAHEQSK